MPTQEIPNYEWVRFFDEFSRRHEGWLTTIESLRVDYGDQIQARDLPLSGISVEPDEVAEDQITIMLGDNSDARISHTISKPGRVWLKQNENGEDEALQIESFDGIALLRFRSTSLAEMTYGVRAEKANA
ncbi:MAG TPA: DUF5335 family protein [Blastocatellia bacterium]|nr:DUF5335 family protein [Blastocatellia bacterium]